MKVLKSGWPVVLVDERCICRGAGPVAPYLSSVQAWALFFNTYLEHDHFSQKSLSISQLQHARSAADKPLLASWRLSERNRSFGIGIATEVEQNQSPRSLQAHYSRAVQASKFVRRLSLSLLSYLLL